ncbi:MAG: hypothetical protein WCX65_19735 [bacterium]
MAKAKKWPGYLNLTDAGHGTQTNSRFILRMSAPVAFGILSSFVFAYICYKNQSIPFNVAYKSLFSWMIIASLVFLARFVIYMGLIYSVVHFCLSRFKKHFETLNNINAFRKIRRIQFMNHAPVLLLVFFIIVFFRQDLLYALRTEHSDNLSFDLMINNSLILNILSAWALWRFWVILNNKMFFQLTRTENPVYSETWDMPKMLSWRVYSLKVNLIAYMIIFVYSWTDFRGTFTLFMYMMVLLSQWGIIKKAKKTQTQIRGLTNDMLKEKYWDRRMLLYAYDIFRKNMDLPQYSVVCEELKNRKIADDVEMAEGRSLFSFPPHFEIIALIFARVSILANNFIYIEPLPFSSEAGVIVKDEIISITIQRKRRVFYFTIEDMIEIKYLRNTINDTIRFYPSYLPGWLEMFEKLGYKFEDKRIAE